MAAQYANRQFFRKTPNLYLAKFFETKGIQLNVNQLKEQGADVLRIVLFNSCISAVTRRKAWWWHNFYLFLNL